MTEERGSASASTTLSKSVFSLLSTYSTSTEVRIFFLPFCFDEDIEKHAYSLLCCRINLLKAI